MYIDIFAMFWEDFNINSILKMCIDDIQWKGGGGKDLQRTL